jgi:hypothetical protein
MLSLSFQVRDVWGEPNEDMRPRDLAVFLDGRDFILTGSASGGVILLEITLSGDIGVIDSLGAVEGLGFGAIVD